VSAPEHLRVRSYNVGFGDCFLLTFSYGRARARNILIDFGSTKLAKSSPNDGMKAIAEKIREDCGGKLDIVVATHRHTDHISGFGGEPGETIRSLDPELVLQPWTEDPELAPDAIGPGAVASDGRARGLVASLAAMNATAAAIREQVPRLEASRSVPRSVVEQLRFLGETNIANEAAVRNLMTMGSRRIYAAHGTKLPVKRLLPGIAVDVIGPPTLRQSSAIAHQASTSADEFWHVAAAGAAAQGDPERASRPIFPGAAIAEARPQEARWVIPQIDRMRAEEMLAIVRSLDDVLNNTSLILLFEVAGRLFVFPGDAQLENWRYALREAPGADATRERLEHASFYKVGHHGSLNATPKSLWNAFDHRGPDATPDRLVTMLSTAADKHGSVARNTEVPRRVLVEELERASALRNTQSLSTKATFWIDADFDLTA
jgi:hypothetical protein